MKEHCCAASTDHNTAADKDIFRCLPFKYFDVLEPTIAFGRKFSIFSNKTFYFWNFIVSITQSQKTQDFETLSDEKRHYLMKKDTI